MQDAWGNNYVYNNPQNFTDPVTITSYGADGVAGGTGVNADIVMTITPQEIYSNIYGQIYEGSSITTRNVQENLYYCDGNGNVTSATTSTTSSSRTFNFTNIPRGSDSLEAGSPTVASYVLYLKYLTFAVDQPNVVVPSRLTNLDVVPANSLGGTATVNPNYYDALLTASPTCFSGTDGITINSYQASDPVNLISNDAIYFSTVSANIAGATRFMVMASYQSLLQIDQITIDGNAFTCTKTSNYTLSPCPASTNAWVSLVAPQSWSPNSDLDVSVHFTTSGLTVKNAILYWNNASYPRGSPPVCTL